MILSLKYFWESNLILITLSYFNSWRIRDRQGIFVLFIHPTESKTSCSRDVTQRRRRMFSIWERALCHTAMKKTRWRPFFFNNISGQCQQTLGGDAKCGICLPYLVVSKCLSVQEAEAFTVTKGKSSLCVSTTQHKGKMGGHWTGCLPVFLAFHYSLQTQLYHIIVILYLFNSHQYTINSLGLV